MQAKEHDFFPAPATAENDAAEPAANASSGLHCPHCASNSFQRWGAAAGMPRFRCNDCKRTFNPLTGTSLARLRSKDKWLVFMQTCIEHRSVRKSAEICGIDASTAQRWRQRFDECSTAEKQYIVGALLQCSPGLMQMQESTLSSLPVWIHQLLPTVLAWLAACPPG
jgi:transposase-like protein